MPDPLFESYELRRIARVLGAILVLTGGLVLLLQAYAVDVLPPAGGFMDTTAIVNNLQRTGTFQDPAFLVTLVYQVQAADGTSQEIRSGLRVPYEQYRSLAIGDRVQIHYNASNLFEWRLIVADTNQISEYGLGLLMFIFGALSLSFPAILAWASRQKEFEFSDELEEAETSGAVTYPYGNRK